MVIDRLAPARRPRARPIQLQSWRDLLFLHWKAPREALQAALPRGLTLDLHQEEAYLGVVAFAIFHARPSWLPGPLGLSFLETNLRTYVHVEGRDPGVHFFSLDAASRLAVLGARWSFGLPYHHARMARRPAGPAVRYELERTSGARPRLAVEYRPGAERAPAAPGTLDHFLIERYLLHVERRGRLWSCQVHHAPYPLREAQAEVLEEGLARASGLPAVGGGAPLVHFSPGVDTEVFAPFQR